MRKNIRMRGNHDTENRCGRRLWTESRYPENINTMLPTNEASIEAFIYLKKNKTATPAKTKCNMISQFHAILKGRKRKRRLGG